MIKKMLKFIVLVTMSTQLVGCGKSDEDKLISEYVVLDEFVYGGINNSKNESNLTQDEKVKMIIREDMGLPERGEDVRYKKFGISNNNGIVISSLILEGPEFPKISAFSNEEITAINKKGSTEGAVYSNKFNEIIEGKKEKVSNYSDEEYEEYIKNKLTE